jgi:hypothetical protein
MLSQKLTNLRNHWHGVLSGDVPSRGLVGVTDLVRNLDACIEDAKALEAGVVPETADLQPRREMPLDRTNAEQAVLRYLRAMAPEERARAEAVMEAMALACGDHLPADTREVAA